MELPGNPITVCRSAPDSDTAAAVRKIQILTIAWMTIELLVSLIVGFRAHSIALTAFGVDSGIELLSASIVLWQFHAGPHTERTAARVNAGLLYALAVYIVITSVLSFSGKGPQPKPSVLGIALLVAAAVIMPILGAAKKRLAKGTRSGALKADAAQSNLCAYMTWIALGGLGINLVWHLPLADSVAGLLLLPIILIEANEARKGEICEC